MKEESTLLFAVSVEEQAGLARHGEHVRFGVPLPRGRLAHGDQLHVVDSNERVLTHQATVLARWPDRSARWLLLDVCVDVDAHSAINLTVCPGSKPPSSAFSPLRCTRSDGAIAVDANVVSFSVPGTGPQLLMASSSDGRPLLGGEGVTLQLVDASGRRHNGTVESATIEEQGPLRASVCVEGRFAACRRLRPLQFTVRSTFFSGRSSVALEVTITNTRAARHAANLWDLGDRGSCHFRELTVVVATQAMPSNFQWSVDPQADYVRQELQPWTVYQDSSGGDNWHSSNHIDANGDLTVRFRGYRVFGTSVGDVMQEGSRAQPVLNASMGDTHATVAMQWFWQNFPSSIALRPDSIRVGLFPAESGTVFELQGGERKRQVLWLDVGTGNDGSYGLRCLEQRLQVRRDFQMCADSKAVPYLASLSDAAYSNYVGTILDGVDSFVANREKIDEYGWRNFGDLYADHEAINSPEGKPLVSHYNNQYDFVFAAGLHFLRTGDARWFHLMEESASHAMDIDLYHTTEDRPAYNGGQFWHTDHYRDAATATHRTYSRANYMGSPYGGGPSSEHNYTSGLLLYYLLTGDPDARKAVLQLADWVIAMDDGSRTVLSIFSSRPTGLASCTVSQDFHKPGRGAGNSINALLDAYAACGNRTYLGKAEELVHRCIHPEDDVEALGLGNPEYRWSYLVFLQVLGKYLDLKGELREFDYHFHYARESLLRYADWVLANEVPYRDVLHKVELPTETWPAQDIRKCHVMHLAARHCRDDRAKPFSDKADHFHARCIDDLLSFETARLTRPRVIVAVYALVHDYFRKAGYEGDGRYSYEANHNFHFGSPQEFESQRDFLPQAMRSRCQLVASEIRRVLGDVSARFKLRVGASRREPR